MDRIDLDSLRARLNEFDALRTDDEIKTHTVERIQPQLATEWPTQLDSSVRNALIGAGIQQPYQHQADAIIKSLDGADVVMESPTASGKTLAFTAPMLHSLVRNDGSHALMIYPTKALAFDQRMQLTPVCEPLAIASWPYDGDNRDDHRMIRSSKPQILLTNPETLNSSFLGWREQWTDFLRDLRYIVIDEMHEYRGFFGGNMALLLRRFFLHLNQLGASPRVFLSTATCANPEEHAYALTGRNMSLVSARAVLLPRRHFIFVDPEIRDFRYREALQWRVEQAALAALSEGLQVLVFCPTKRFLEDAVRDTRRKAADLKLNPDKISPFHANLKNEDRWEIQEKVKAGDISVVFTTNALELGLDIGGLDGVILAGFPPSIMSAWQQIGRAGRGWDKDAFVLFYAMNDPIDRFFVGNLEAFLSKPFDELVVDPANEQLIENHLPSLEAEIEGVKPDEAGAEILGETFYSALPENPVKQLRNYRPQINLRLRGGMGRSFDLKINDDDSGQIDGMRRFREAYIGAVFPFNGRRYRVHSHEERAIVLVDTEQYLRTDARFYTALYTNDYFHAFRYGDVEVVYGSVNTSMTFTGYQLIDERGGDQIGVGGDPDSHNEYKLHAFWINIPNREDAGAIGAMEHMIRVGAMFVIPADRFDTSTFSRTGNDQAVFYYENYSGGIGVAKKLFEVWHVALEKGIEIARNCSCRSGCQNCIEPAKSYNMSTTDIDKLCGIELAERLLSIAKEGPDEKLEGGRMVPV